MKSPFQLAACAEMLWRDRPIEWRASRLKELGFGVGLWNWPEHDLAKLEATGATFTIMNGYLEGRLTDDEGAAQLLKTARETARVGKRLGVQRLNLHGTGLGEGGLPIRPVEVVTGAMWLKARATLCRVVELAEEEDVTFSLENLNLLVDHPGVPFGRAGDTLALVASIDHPRLTLNLDLYHAQIGEGNLIELCRKCLPWIGEIQVADVPGRLEPGTGEVNWKGVARALKAMGYTGPVAMEAYASGDPEEALVAFREAFTV
ncbi:MULTISPECIES: TIM barrel protein [Rhizobium]|uniref:TIM barrel protein n=1 Tax=Rhizobium rhododendri TaxID=2506430 RepID=A0ABY8IKJ7_9HYPH|nr:MULTISPECIES: TIM barrel protein [Rhizobium]MBZ5759942.1 TIM barrel protein [Rhizobium sp. VS19-DR96]MBZ5766577.1 TIM barrel protein [Rhizobium sp. VS19-DR129.2]MBZ5774080.1 TIM barrel protein [Rhizobium sp. VS19-DRK62.2]MBZ5785152.1 TIM barrel protein [Rhizobium sp. VS19-DR121]MBZ5802751.1 TIM barrel protein [Rhizobium sp. VS19-DR181]